MDRDALRFHWFKDLQTKTNEVLRFTRALFGLAPSPLLLGELLNNIWPFFEQLTMQYSPMRCDAMRCHAMQYNTIFFKHDKNLQFTSGKLSSIK